MSRTIASTRHFKITEHIATDKIPMRKIYSVSILDDDGREVG